MHPRRTCRPLWASRRPPRCRAPRPSPSGEAQLDRLREYRPQKGGWEWWCQTHAPCPCTGCFLAQGVTVAGLWRPIPARAPQSRWHTITTCCVGDSALYRSRAMGWLAHRLSDFGTQQAHYALTALSGGADRLGPRERHAALRFMLGLPDAPRSQLVVESPEAARTLALGYGRGFLKWIVAIIGEGGRRRARPAWARRQRSTRFGPPPSHTAIALSSLTGLPPEPSGWLREAFGRCGTVRASFAAASGRFDFGPP